MAGGDNREALLLHDLVPGGTGYLAELARPENVWPMLRTAWEKVATCPCAGEGRLACHRCLLPYAPRNRPVAVSRAAAERHLRAILTAGTGGEPGEVMTWNCTTEEPAPSTSLESHLEQHFRRVFTDLVRELSGTLTEVPGPYGNSLHFGLPGGRGRTWLLEPQVTLGTARPDFLLSCTDTNVPRIAIFTDGYTYHAAAEGALADDARQRRDLSDSERLVLSVTAADLALPAPLPGWYADAAWPLLVQQAATVVPLADTLRQGPVAFLRWWLTDSVTSRQGALADVVPYFFAAGRESFPLDGEEPLAAIAAGLQDGVGAMPGSATGLCWQRDALTVLVRIRAAREASMLTEIAAVLDDRPAAMAGPAFREAWQDWLRLANGLQHHTIPVEVTTRTLLTAEVGAAPTATEPGGLEPGWQEAWASM